jgi:cysteine desulfurase / selenocysteine lyase
MQVVVSVAEHHANIVPWQMVCAATGATLKHVGLSDTEEIDIDDLRNKVTPKTKLIALPHVSNVLGCILPVQQVMEIARDNGALVLLDACQSVAHMPVDVQVCVLEASPSCFRPPET